MKRPSYEDHIEISGNIRNKKTAGQKLESLVPTDIVPCVCRGRFCKGGPRTEMCWRFVGIDMTYKLKKQMERIEKSNLTHQRDTEVTSLVLRATPLTTPLTTSLTPAFDCIDKILQNSLWESGREYYDLEGGATAWMAATQEAEVETALMEPLSDQIKDAIEKMKDWH